MKESETPFSVLSDAPPNVAGPGKTPPPLSTGLFKAMPSYTEQFRVGCRHFCGHAWSRVWRALTTLCRTAGCFNRGGETGNVATPQTESVRRQGPMTGPASVQVRRQSGPPRVRTQLSNQETQILMTTLNGPMPVDDM